MATNCIFFVHTNSIPTSFLPSSTPSTPLLLQSSSFPKIKDSTKFISINNLTSATMTETRRRRVIVCGMLPLDPWAPNIDTQSIASQLFAFSLFPYLGFLYFITKSKSAPKLTLFGFYFLLAFVGATIPAGIYAKVHYGTSLSNVDWLHGGAESLLTLSNLFVVLGLRKSLREPMPDDNQSDEVSGFKEENPSS